MTSVVLKCLQSGSSGWFIAPQATLFISRANDARVFWALRGVSPRDKMGNCGVIASNNGTNSSLDPEFSIDIWSATVIDIEVGIECFPGDWACLGHTLRAKVWEPFERES